MSFLVRYLGVSIWNVKSTVKFCWSLHQPSKVKQTIHRNYKTHKICKLLRKNKQKPTNTIYTKHNTHYFYFRTTYSLAYFSTTILNKRNLKKKKKKRFKVSLWKLSPKMFLFLEHKSVTDTGQLPNRIFFHKLPSQNLGLITVKLFFFCKSKRHFAPQAHWFPFTPS